MRKTDKAWNEWGSRNPYYGVLTSDEYRGTRLSESAKTSFFQTGQAHWNHVLTTIRTHLDPGFSPRRAVDFGCGTGRVIIAMSKNCEEVVGIDISDAMLAETRDNCREFNATNVTLKKSDDALSALSGAYDMIHSFIVFQHIPWARGRKMLRLLLEHLSPDGVAVIHIAWKWDAGASQRLAYYARHYLPFAHTLMRWLRGRHRGDPRMEMNIYSMNRVLELIDEAGCTPLHVELVHHGDHRGAILYAFKGKRAGTEHDPP